MISVLTERPRTSPALTFPPRLSRLFGTVGVWHHPPPLPRTGAERPDHTGFLWNSNHFSFREGLGKGQRQDSGLVLPSTLAFALRNTVLLCLLASSLIIPGQAPVLCAPSSTAPYLGRHQVPSLAPAPPLSLTQTSSSSELVTMRHFPSTLLCRIDHWYSDGLFSCLLYDCQHLEGKPLQLIQPFPPHSAPGLAW